MERDFGEAIVEGMRMGFEEDEEEDEHEVVEVETLNHERDEIVGKVGTDGNLNTKSEALRNVSQEYLDRITPSRRG